MSFPSFFPFLPRVTVFVLLLYGAAAAPLYPQVDRESLELTVEMTDLGELPAGTGHAQDGPVTFSPDGRRAGFVIQVGTQQAAVVAGQLGPESDGIRQMEYASVPIDAFAGTWEGVYYSHPHPMGITVTVTATGGTGVEGEVRFHPLDRESRSAIRAPEGSFSVRGSYDPVLRTFNFTPGAWTERRRAGGQPFGLQGVFDRERPALAGLFAGPRNDAYFTLVRPDQAHHLTGPMLDRPTQRARVSTPGDDVLVRWASRFTEEHPGINTARTPIDRLYALAVNLFEDMHFRAHFGTTFDQMSVGQRDAVERRFAAGTRRYGGRLGRLRGRPSEELREHRALRYAFSSSGSQSAIRVVHMVLAQRVIRAWHADQLARIAGVSPRAEAFADLDRLAAAAEDALRTLWPSEQSAFQSTIEQARGPVAVAAAQALVDDLVAAAPSYDAAVGLANWAQGRDRMLAYVPGDVRAALATRVGARLDEILIGVLPDDEQSIDRVSLSMAGIEELNGLFRDFDRRYGMFKDYDMVNGMYERFHRKKEEILIANAVQIDAQINGAVSVDQLEDLDARYFVALHSERGKVADVRNHLIQRREAIEAEERRQQIEAQAAAQQRAQAALAAQNEALAAENALLTPKSFSARGLANEALMTRIYRGEFVNIDLDRDDMRLALLYSAYLNSYAKQCPAHLPADKIEMTRQVCSSWMVTRDGWGNEVNRNCNSWETVSTGLYADPEMYKAKFELEMLQAGDAFRLAFGVFSADDPVAQTFNLVGDVATFSSDMARLLRLNACDSPGLMRFQDNLRLFALNKRPKRLAGEAVISTVVNPPPGTLFEDQNYTRFIEDLVYDQSSSWVMNRYERGSISNVTVSSRDDLGRPIRIRARYSYTGLSGRTQGSVTLTFDDGWPECLYFYDNQAVCRSPNRRIVDAYAKGSY